MLSFGPRHTLDIFELANDCLTGDARPPQPRGE